MSRWQKKLCDFDADPDHDLDPGFFIRNIQHCGKQAIV